MSKAMQKIKWTKASSDTWQSGAVRIVRRTVVRRLGWSKSRKVIVYEVVQNAGTPSARVAGEKKSLRAAKNYAATIVPAETRPNPRPTSASSAGTFRFGRIPFGVFNHGDTMVHGDVWAYVDVFNEKGRPIGGGIAITAIPESRGRGPVWIFPTPDGDGPYLDGQAHTAVGRVWASARWANADRDAVIVSAPSTAKKSA